ncbi:type IV-A pilus assembly ATPase PilB, partial [Methylococcaceae bacterium HT1]
RQHHALPLFQRGNRLFIALSDPTNIQALDDIKFHTRLNTETILVEEDKLTRAIESFIDAADTSMDDLLDLDLENIILTDGNEQATEEDTSEIDDAPTLKILETEPKRSEDF